MAMRISSREVWRDYVTDGVPSSGPNKPNKRDIRTWSKWVEDIITAIFSGSGLIYATLASLNADLNHTPNSLAWVIGDSEVANNGIYMKLGLAGAGSWQRVGDLPYSFIFASNIGAGSPSAIQATTSIPVSSDTLILLQIAEDYAGDAATVSFNGAVPLTIKTNSGADVRNLAGGSVVYGVISSGVFRLANDEAIASLIYEARDDAVAAEAAAQLAQDGAEAARDIAAGFASDIVSQATVPNFSTRIGLFDLELPEGMNRIWVAGEATPEDGHSGIFVRVAVEPAARAIDKVRTADRFLPTGVISPVSGGWWRRVYEADSNIKEQIVASVLPSEAAQRVIRAARQITLTQPTTPFYVVDPADADAIHTVFNGGTGRVRADASSLEEGRVYHFEVYFNSVNSLLLDFGVGALISGMPIGTRSIDLQSGEAVSVRRSTGNFFYIVAAHTVDYEISDPTYYYRRTINNEFEHWRRRTIQANALVSYEFAASYKATSIPRARAVSLVNCADASARPPIITSLTSNAVEIRNPNAFAVEFDVIIDGLKKELAA